MWVAAYRGLCESWCILPIWDSYCCGIGILLTAKRKRSMDRNSSWFFPTNNYAFCNNKPYKLGKTGLLTTLNSICFNINSFFCVIYYVVLIGEKFHMLQATKARERIFKEGTSEHDRLMWTRRGYCLITFFLVKENYQLRHLFVIKRL